LPGAGDGSGFALSFAGRRSSVETRPDKEANMAKTGVTPQVSGLERGATLRGRAAKLMTGAVAKLVVGPVRSQVTFTDDNGPKGGRAMRCALTVRLPYRPTLRVERAAETPRLAFDAAFAVLLRPRRGPDGSAEAGAPGLMRVCPSSSKPSAARRLPNGASRWWSARE
jgi:hypothetical protein